MDSTAIDFTCGGRGSRLLSQACLRKSNLSQSRHFRDNLNDKGKDDDVDCDLNERIAGLPKGGIGCHSGGRVPLKTPSDEVSEEGVLAPCKICMFSTNLYK